jgi:hypothetical protein
MSRREVAKWDRCKAGERGTGQGRSPHYPSVDRCCLSSQIFYSDETASRAVYILRRASLNPREKKRLQMGRLVKDLE